MKLQRRRFLQGAAAAAALPALSSMANAETYPTRPVRIIVPFGAGGSNDLTTRALANAAQGYLGQPIVVENLTGGSGEVGANAVVRARPDGYTVGTPPLSVLLAPSYKKEAYDARTDFSYIIGVTAFSYGLVVRSDSPWKTFREFLDDAKANPGKISYGTPGALTMQHLTMDRIARQQGVNWVSVPFRGDPDALAALMGGHIHAVMTTSSWAPYVDSGQLRLLVTVGSEREKKWPSVPTLKESGIDLALISPLGVTGPKGMDPQIVQVLHDAFKRAFDEPAFRTTLSQLNEEPLYLGSADFRATTLKLIGEWEQAFAELGLKRE
jgi:tripartite-type tricarboxylate transporter receptor subunit TctC